MNVNLSALGLVDSAPQPAFDNLTRLASQLLGAPVSLISIVDFANDRQFFKSLLGLPEPWATRQQTPLTHSFCQHVVHANAALVIENAPKHPLVCDNLAIRDLGVIAYLGVPVYTPDNRPAGALCVIQSEPRQWTAEEISLLQQLASCVSDAIRLNGALHDNEELRQEHQAVANAISQDPKTAANTIEMVLQELLLEPQSDDGRELLIAGITTVERMSDQVEDVRAYAAIIGGIEDHGQVDLNTLILEIKAELSGDLSHAQATLVCDVLPTVFGIAVQLRSLFRNLVSNAIKFRAEDRLPVISINTAAEPLGRFHEIKVSDNGIGIAPEDQDKIFDLFERRHVHEDCAGTGIGLTLCRRICANHNGRLKVVSQLGVGTTLTVVLPNQQVKPPVPARAPAAATG